MANTLGDHLLNTLEDLLSDDFDKFKFKLQNASGIARSHMQEAKPVMLTRLLLNHYGEEYAVRLTLQILQAINQRQLAEKLRKATGLGKWPSLFPVGMAAGCWWWRGGMLRCKLSSLRARKPLPTATGAV